MKAITTKYLNPSNTKSGRIKASDADGNQITIDYPHEISGVEDKHRAAALALCKKMHWTTTGMQCGLIKDGQWAFTFPDRQGDTVTALGLLVLYITSGDHYESSNPYCRPLVQQALEALANATHRPADAWMEAAEPFKEAYKAIDQKPFHSPRR